MQNDPDLYPSSTQPREYYSAGNNVQTYPGTLNNGGASKLTVYFAGIFTFLNLIFLGLAAAYSLGMFSQDSSSIDGASYFVSVVMVLIAGSLALASSVIGLHLSKAQGASKLTLANRIFIIATVLLAILVLIGPVISKASENSY